MTFPTPNKPALTLLATTKSPTSSAINFLKEEIVPETPNYAGAELEELVNRAKRNAFEIKEKTSVGTDDFLKSLKLFRIDQKSREDSLEEYKKLALEYTDDVTFLKELNIEEDIK